MCDLMAQNSHRVFILFNSCFLCTRAVCGLLYQEFIWPSSRRTKDGKKQLRQQKYSYVFFKSIIVLKESEEQVRYSRSDSTMKGEPLFSA